MVMIDKLTFILLGASQYWLMCDICGKTNYSQFRYYIQEHETAGSLGGFYCKSCKEKIEKGEVSVKSRSNECDYN